MGKGFDAVEHVVTFGLEHRLLGQTDGIGIDEIQNAKGHKCLTLVYQIDLSVSGLGTGSRFPSTGHAPTNRTPGMGTAPMVHWAQIIGPQTARLLERILADKPHPETG